MPAKISWGGALIALLAMFPATSVAQAVPRLIHQEGLVIDETGGPAEGPVRLEFRLYAVPAGGQPAWSEAHAEVSLFEGYYSVLLGAERPLTGELLVQAQYLGIAIDGGAELAPRVRLAAVPFAFVAQSVSGGPVNAASVSVGGNLVINDQGRWVGDPAGLRGPPGPEGPQGPPGPAGGEGSPDTPAQVLGKITQVDGAGSGLDADLLDGLSSDRFMRTDRDTGTTGSLSAGDGLAVSSRGQSVGRFIGQIGTHVDAERQLRLDPQDGVNEGGHLHFAGAGNDQDWAIDAYQGSLRIYEPTPSRAENRRRGSLQIFRNGGVSVNISGDLTVGALRASGLEVAGRQIIDGTGKLNQAQWDLYSEVRVLTNTTGNPDRNMYVNYPSRADSRTFLYNDPQVVGTLEVTGNVRLGGSTLFDSGVTYTCEAGGGGLGNCPNSGFWTFDKIVLEHNHADVPARMASIPTGSMSVEGIIRADGEIASGSNITAGGELRAGASRLTNGALRLGPGASEQLTAAQLSTLVGGGNADALHTHAAQHRRWIRVGNLNDFFNVEGLYPHDQYEYGVTYNTRSILPVVINHWNAGVRVTGQYHYIVGDRFPWEGGNSFTFGGSAWFWNTHSNADNACNAGGSWYQYYYLNYGNPNPHNSHGETYFWSSNGCSVPNLYVRPH